ncbi:MAG: hypothetical protein IT361_05485 [Gemmatimonadaceae bacterium]|nr:hypothetical protein [Gemmatimonadaceae bacterium]
MNHDPGGRRKWMRDSALLIGTLWGGTWAGRAVAKRSFAAARDGFSDGAVPKVGGQLLLVYVGSSRCGPSNAADLPNLVRSISGELRAEGARRGLAFVSVGVGREVSATSGMVHLHKIAAFDEVAAGQGVLNQASAHFVDRDHRGMAATPQLIVLIRRVGALPAGGVDPGLVSERVLLRKVGLQDIRNWSALGAPVPESDLASA